MSETRIIRYQLSFPALNKKLYEKFEKEYNVAVIQIRLDELQEKGAKLTKIGKPTFGGTLLTFVPVKNIQEYQDAMNHIIKDGEALGIKFEKKVAADE